MLVPGVHTIYAVADGYLPSFPVLVEISSKWPPIPKVKHFILHPAPLGRTAETKIEVSADQGEDSKPEPGDITAEAEAEP